MSGNVFARNCSVPGCFTDKSNWCRNEQVCKTLSGPTKWILPYIKHTFTSPGHNQNTPTIAHQLASETPTQLLDHPYTEHPDVAPLSHCDMKHYFTAKAKYAGDIDRTKATVPGQLDVYNIHINEATNTTLAHISNPSEEIVPGANACMEACLTQKKIYSDVKC